MRKYSILLTITFSAPLLAQEIDPDFGIDSTYTWLGAGVNAPYVRDLLVHPDGHIWVITEDAQDAKIHGLTAQGLLDTNFATAGIYVRPGDLTQTYWDAEMAPGGSEVYVMGTLKTLTNYTTIGVDRFTADGALSTWGFQGTRTVDISNCDGTRGYCMLVRPDGRLLLGGRCDEGFAFGAIAVTAVAANGVNDYSLNGSNQYVHQMNGSNEIARDLALDSGGGLVIAVSMSGYGSALRLDASGAADTDWSDNGSYPMPTGATRVRRLANNKLLLMSLHTLGRLLPNGDADITYGPEGLFTPTHPNGEMIFDDMIMDGEGRILIAGEVADHAMVMRLLPTAEVDSSFGTNGVVVAPWGDMTSPGISVAVDAGGGILLSFGGGTSGSYTGRICRFLPDQSTGVSRNKPINTDLRAWPNPATDVLHVEPVPTPTPVQVMDALGREVLRTSDHENGNIRLAIEGLHVGVYTVRAGARAVRFVKQ